MAEIDKNCVEGNCFAINDKSHASGDTTLNIVYKANYTGQICTARFRIKSKDGSVVKEYMIAQEAKPVYYNIKMVQAFTKDDCMANQHGTVVLYTVPERRYSSLISQEDADAKALEDINLNGQDYANLNGECITDIWYNKEVSKTVNRNDCDQFSDGQPYTYTVPEGKYVSSISQADADAKAQADLDANAQQQANLEGECRSKENIFYGKYSMEFTRNNCTSTEYGTKVTVDETMVKGDFRSIESQEAANALAEAAVKAQGQDIANTKGNCEDIPVYTGKYSKVFQRTNCPDGSTPADFTVTERMCEGYPFESTVSQDEANRMAQEAVEEQGQAITNEQGDCVTNLYFNVRKERTVNRNNCDAFSDGQPYTYVVPAGKYSSNVSQADADAKADADIEANAQQQANLEGECTPKPNIYYGKFEMEFTRNNCTESEYGSTVMVDETMVTGDFRSLESQEAANALAEAAVRAQGQDIANTKGKCDDVPVFTGKASKEFTRTNCAEGGVPGKYTVNEKMCDGYPFTSTVSQQEADAAAQRAVDEQGQALANIHATCTWTGHASMSFIKNDCDPVSENGTAVEVTEADVEGGPFTSNDSQAAADSIAMTAVQAQGQAIANERGECVEKTKYIGEASFEFTKSDCPENQVGNPFVVTQDMVEGHPFVSYVSQEEANLVALAAVMDQGQAVANERGDCREADKYTGHYSESFTKDDCETGMIPTSVTVTEGDVTGGPFYSYESQFAADELAREAVQAQGQAIANERGSCNPYKIYVGSYSRDFTPACPDCQYADPVTVTPALMGQMFMSENSQEAADAMAKEYVDRMGQAYVDKNYAQNCHTIEEQPRWETIEEVCKDCISQLRQHNVNDCYTGPSQEQYVPGGSKTCFWFGVASGQFTTQCADGGVGSVETVTQDELTDPEPTEGGKFKSCVSQEDANSKAEAALAEQGQAIANRKGTCTWNGHYSGQVQKSNCPDGGVGDNVTVDSSNMSGHPFPSNVSLADANRQAQEAVMGAEGQDYANKNGGCTWSYEATRTFYRECPDEGEPQAIEVTSTQANGGTMVTSRVSLADAQSKAEQALDNGGQDYANSHGTCVWTGDASISLDKSDCGTCEHSARKVTVYYSYLGLTDITSTISQADANQKALNALNGSAKSQAQAYANKNGSCDPDSTADEWDYGDWSYYCNGSYVARRRTVYQRNDCSPNDTYTETDSHYEYCENGCSGGSCITCDSTLRPTGSYRCTNGYSQQLYESECGYSEWRGSLSSPNGTACCNDNTVSGGSANKSGCECTTQYSWSGVGPDDVCGYSSTSAANSAAQSRVNSNKSSAESSTPCNQMKTNEYVSATATKQGCPSNCTAPTASAYWSPGTVNVDCGGDGSSRRCFESCDQAEATRMAQADADRLAQEKANAMECDCPEEPCRANLSLQRGSTHSSPPGISWSVTCNCSGNCSSSELSQMRSYSVTVSCASNNDSTTESGSVSCNAGTGERTTFFSSSCDPSTISVSLN